MKHRFLLLLLCLLLSTSIQAQNGLNFDGVNDRINCGNDASVQLSGTQITLEAWIYATAWQPNVFEGGIINKEQNNPDNGYMLRAGDGGRLNFNLGNFGWNELTTLPILNLNTWHHVAGTYDGSMMRLYVDGMAIDSQTVSITLSSASQNLTIGNWSNPGSERPFIGVIDEVRIWDVARSQADLISAMSTELCNPPASLIVYYRLNEGSAGGNNASQTTATDASGNGNDGTLINFALSGTSSNWATGTVPAGAAIGMDVQTACDSYTWIDGNTYTTSNNNATFTIVGGAASGCDSLVSLDLTINAAAQGTDVQTACDTYTWIDGNTYTMSNNSASFTLAGGAANGCDSVVTLDLTINAAAQGVDVQTACNTYTWIDGNTYTSDNNSASFTLAGGAANGCDSVVTLDLTLETIETGVTQAGITLTSNSDTSGVSYQWL
ncbi:MAG: LamG domain-containing protein, partial [Bacteroidota bacterium]